jgi:carbonic anhydrase
LKTKNNEHKTHIDSIIGYLASENEQKNLPDSSKTNIDLAVKANVLHGVNLLNTSSPVLASLVEEKKLQVVGAVYDLDDGKVNFLETKK